MSEQKIVPNELFWRFDVSTFKLLGRELITDRITALFEIVKNSYDANATNVNIEFIKINPLSSHSKIIIKDDGIGMSLSDIKEKWMVIGTNSKRRNRNSPPPMYRKMVGKKGVGRFAVDKLGSKLILKSRQIGAEKTVCLSVDWNKYEGLSKESDNNQADLGFEKIDFKITIFNTKQVEIEKKYFTEIANEYWYEDPEVNFYGTILEISSIRDIWDPTDIERAYRELAKLVSPLEKPIFPFNIYINSPENKEYNNRIVRNNAIKHSTEEITLRHHKSENEQEILKHENGYLKVVNTKILSFGPVNFKLYYFDKKAKDAYKKDYQGSSIDGIKIYRDGLITTPFAEYEAQDIKKRDILGIDKRRYSSFFDKVSSADLIGILDITDADNPSIKDSTNRQDFEDNKEYRDLKQFIVGQIEELESYITYNKKSKRARTKSNLITAHDNLKLFNDLVKEIKDQAPPALKEKLIVLEKQSQQLKIEVNKGIKDFNELEEEKIRQENLFFSLMSLQDYAFEIAHVVNTSLARIMSFAEFYKFEFPNPELNEHFIYYANEIYDEMEKLKSILSFLLSYAKSNISFSPINIKELIEDLMFHKYKNIFDRKGIISIVEIDKPLIITHNYKFFEDIIENLISNSIKAVEDNIGEKIIKCSGLSENDKFVLYFSDNGYGIKEEDKDKVFNIYFTRTAEKGGAGLGLYIVKTRIQSMKGLVEVVENQLKPNGTTIKISLPFANPKPQNS